MTSQAGVPEFQAIKSRIVTFRQEGSNLYMLEAPTGNTVDTTLDADLVLAEFPITSQTDTQLTFDFNAGMSRLFYTIEGWASDYYGDDYSDSFESIPVAISYIDWVQQDDDGRLSLRQVARLELDASSDQVAIEYYLSSYQPNPHFVSTESPGFDEVGYFEVAPVLKQGGGTTLLAMKHDISQTPLTYAISANTPQAYRQAIREGINYWNSVMGAGFITVIDAPADVSAPDPDYNLIQWIDYDNAGYAFADFMADPRTGEILHAQIFLTSSWVAAAFRSYIWSSFNEETEVDNSSTHIGLYQLTDQDAPCRIDMTRMVGEQVAALSAAGATSAELERASLDILQFAVAHEVGHTLGLRHNFSGSTISSAIDLTPVELLNEYRKAIDDDASTLPGVPLEDLMLTTSIMDYPEWHTPLIGYQVGQGTAFSHDEASMHYLYDTQEPLDAPLFCTDTAVNGIFLDCATYDSGTPVQDALNRYKDSLRVGPQAFMRHFIASLAAYPGSDTKTIEETYIFPKNYAGILPLHRARLLKPSIEGNYYLSELKEIYPYLSATELQTYLEHGYFYKPWLLEMKQKRLETDFEQYLGLAEGSLLPSDVAALLPPLDPAILIAQWQEEFAMLLTDQAMGMGPWGEYQFTSAEVSLIQEKMEQFFSDLGPALVTADINALAAGTIDVIDGPAGEGLLQALAAIAETYLLEEEKPAKTITLAFGTDSSIELPVFAYDWQMRAAAINLISSKRAAAGLASWGADEREALATAFDDYFTELLADVVSAAEAEHYTDGAVDDIFFNGNITVYNWYMELLYLYDCLN